MGALGLLVVSGCGCDEELIGITPPGSCEPTYECQTGYEYRLGECRASRCAVDADCCPGQVCNAAAGFCADQYVACTNDEACEEIPGQACIELRGGRYCGYPNKTHALTSQATERCDSGFDCPTGRSCFNHRCVLVPPCAGGCPQGEVCDVDSNTCYPMDDCKEQCTEGEMLVFDDPDTMSGPACCELECACLTYPPVLPGQYGWHASLAALDDRVLVSAYDSTYGDLIVARFDLEGKPVTLEYVDGFPTSGPITGDPAGPRGGRSEGGTNVGLHTAIGVDPNGLTHVAYHDADAGALKYATLANGVWSTTVVDDEGFTGLYASLGFAPDGSPRIAYLMAEGTIGGDPTLKAALKLAKPKTPIPMGPADWDVIVVDSRDKPLPICNGGCAAGEKCIDLGSGPSCLATTIGCNPTCANDEACIDLSGAPTCESVVPVVVLEGLPAGTGLFSSIAFAADGTPLIAYYDSVDGDLRLAVDDGAGGFVTRTLDGNDAMAPTDVGQHASIAVGPGEVVGVAYFDATSDDLVYYDVGTRTREIADDGVTPPNLRFVGADASLVFDDGGKPAIAYHDPTNIDLLYARRIGGTWTTEAMRGDVQPGQMEGTAAGFAVTQARRNNTAYVASVDVDFNEAGDLLLTLGVQTKLLD